MRFDKNAPDLFKEAKKEDAVKKLLDDKRNPFKTTWREYSQGKITMKQVNDICLGWIIDIHKKYLPRNVDLYGNTKVLELKHGLHCSHLHWLYEAQKWSNKSHEKAELQRTIDELVRVNVLIIKKLSEYLSHVSEKSRKA